MNNYQLNNTSIYLGGQCKWDIILENKDGELCVSDFHLSPVSPVIPYSPIDDNYLINYDHGFNLRSFYERTHGDFWNNNYTIDPLSGYDTSRYAGVRRRQTYSSYHKQFEFLQPLWLENIKEGQYLRFDFDCYAPLKDENGNPIKGQPISRKSLKLTGGDGYHKGFVDYFNNWLSKNDIRYNNNTSPEYQGNNMVGYVSFEDRQMLISGIDASSGESAGIVDVSYMLSNFLSCERPLIETDNMITELFRNYRLVAYQLYNFNFCFNISDLVSPSIYNIIKGKSLSVDCVVNLVEGNTVVPLVRKSLFTNYEYVDKALTNNFAIVAGTEWDGDSLEETYKWIPSEETKKNLNDGSISTNVLDYLYDYRYSEFSRVNKLTQDVIHWGYILDSTRTFNIYRGFRGLLQYPTTSKTTGSPTKDSDGNYYYDLSYDDGSNGIATSTTQDTYGEGSNGLAWVQPGRVLWSNGANDANKITYYPLEYINKYGVSIRDIASFWNVNIEQLNIYEDELVRRDIDRYEKILFIYAADKNLDNYDFEGAESVETGKAGVKGQLISIQKYDDDNNEYFVYYLILITNNLNNFMLYNWMRGVEISDVGGIMSIIDTIVYVGNMNIGIQVGTEIDPVINVLGELEYCKSENHTAPIWRHSGEITPFVVERDNNYIYTVDSETNEIIKKKNIVDAKTNKTPIEFVWKDVCCVIDMYDNLKFEIKDLPAEDSWMDWIKEQLGSLYGITDDKEKEYIFNLYDCNINYTHATADLVNYEIKLTLL